MRFLSSTSKNKTNTPPPPPPVPIPSPENPLQQETFINTMPAWVNLLLLSSSGPIKTPVGACATAVESVEIAVDTLLSGKAKVVIAGGYDDFQVILGLEFGILNFFFLLGTLMFLGVLLEGSPFYR